MAGSTVGKTMDVPVFLPLFLTPSLRLPSVLLEKEMKEE
jgi:hypothetical protein